MNIELRRAHPNDTKVYYAWANSKEVRQNAFSKNPISFDDHQKWFNKKLNSPSSYMFIGSDNNILIGQVRFDRSDEPKEFVVDIHLAPGCFGKGYGKELLKRALEKLTQSVDKPFNIVALIFESNTASKKCFEANGFEYTGKETIKGISCLKYNWNSQK